jgi:chromosomal replication initiation ATPase DnaA
MLTAAEIDRVIAMSANLWGMAAKDLRAKHRHRDRVRARWTAAAVMRAEGMSVTQIARALGQHHTTVLHGLERAGQDDAVKDGAWWVRGGLKNERKENEQCHSLE